MLENTIINKLEEIAHQPFLLFLHQINEKTDNSYETLKLLTEEGNVTAGRISEYLDIKPSSVSQIIKKLENTGAIQRVKSPKDARVTYVTLTPIGEAAVQDRSFNSEIKKEMFKEFSEEELKRLDADLAKIVATVTSDSFNEQLNAIFSDDKKWEQFRNMFEQFGRARDQMMARGGFDQGFDGRPFDREFPHPFNGMRGGHRQW